MKLTAIILAYNEASKGNLERCLQNCKQWADEIVVYDDGSFDNSVDVARRYTTHVIVGDKNEHHRESFQRQILFYYAKDTLKSDWIMWLDADEILDRKGAEGEIRKLIDSDVAAYSFEEVNLWRSQTYRRTDSHFTKRFCRLWKMAEDVEFELEPSCTNIVVTPTSLKMKDVVESDIKVIHYGFSSYKHVLLKIGMARVKSRKQFINIARENWILNESQCVCERFPNKEFPRENVPANSWPKPMPIAIEKLQTFGELFGYGPDVVEFAKFYNYDPSEFVPQFRLFV